ncbi:hypothetical protein AK812_SmicGene4641 [Symbiodinium microadriaticum]|uniref:Uncharacterized protein n=1 Tax=Symbiodinium microadriaticum TaxID=2951 RepID=A0A1Q9EVR8_SYMMI|nr:hypothetical protein AK812_SmicGene4641 [Symbiodinium microadriaticum]
MGDEQLPPKRQKLDETWVYKSLGDLDFMCSDDDLRRKVASTYGGQIADFLRNAPAEDVASFMMEFVHEKHMRLQIAMCLQHNMRKLQSPAPPDLISQKFLEVLRNKPAEDPNLNVFDETSGHKTVAPTDEMRARIKQRYNNRCAFCGAEKTQEVPVTCAHLTKRTGKYDQGFPAGFDLQSDRNFIYLCGTKGRLGTCHDGFDTHLLALLPGVLDQPWRVISCYEHFKKQDPHAKLPQFHDPSFRFQPNMLYNRVLSTRLRKFCQQNQRQCQNMENSEEFAKCVDVVSQLSRSASHRGRVGVSLVLEAIGSFSYDCGGRDPGNLLWSCAVEVSVPELVCSADPARRHDLHNEATAGLRLGRIEKGDVWEFSDEFQDFDFGDLGGLGSPPICGFDYLEPRGHLGIAAARYVALLPSWNPAPDGCSRCGLAPRLRYETSPDGLKVYLGTGKIEISRGAVLGCGGWATGSTFQDGSSLLLPWCVLALVLTLLHDVAASAGHDLDCIQGESRQAHVLQKAKQTPCGPKAREKALRAKVRFWARMSPKWHSDVAKVWPLSCKEKRALDAAVVPTRRKDSWIRDLTQENIHPHPGLSLSLWSLNSQGAAHAWELDKVEEERNSCGCLARAESWPAQVEQMLIRLGLCRYRAWPQPGSRTDTNRGGLMVAVRDDMRASLCHQSVGEFGNFLTLNLDAWLLTVVRRRPSPDTGDASFVQALAEHR